jgi:hypothetical protein
MFGIIAEIIIGIYHDENVDHTSSIYIGYYSIYISVEFSSPRGQKLSPRNCICVPLSHF